VILALLSVLFGGVFTVLTAWALGAVLLRRLALEFYPWEERLLAFITGSACLSALVFLLCSVKLARKGVFLALGIAILGYAFYSRAHVSQARALPPLSPAWRCAFGVLFIGFALFYLTNAMAPEMSPDGMAYHLGVVAKYRAAHGFTIITTNMHDNLSQGIEMLFLFAFEFGRHSAAALVHFAFWIALALLMLSYGARIGRPSAGAAGALFTALSPLVGLDGSVAYIDVAEAAVLFAVFYLLQVWDRSRNARMLVPIGILAGFAYAVKYTAGLAVPYALGFIAWKLWKARKPVLRPALAVCALAAAFILPWMVKDWIEVDNPISPFANRVFPNPYVHISQEESWRRYLRTYQLTSYSELPLQLTVKGNHVTGFFGPLFLLTPLALLALRFSAGRRLWLAAAIFALPYFGNVGARFLIPVVPFVSLALALVLADVPILLLLVVGAHAIASLPPVYKGYAVSDGNWFLPKVSPKAALRMIPEDTYLSRESSEYNVDRMIERLVPPGGRVFSFYAPAESYTTRQILVSYLAADNDVLADILWTPLFRDFPPTRLLKFQFPAREFRKVRVIQTENLPVQQWSVSELRVFRAGRELPRASGWSLTASPNPWDVQLAFDNSPATRWRSWQAAQPGMYVEVDFGRAENIDSVVVESSGDSAKTKLKLDCMQLDGRWSTVSDRLNEIALPIRVSLRLAASYELKARGVRYVLIDDGDLRAEDFRVYASLWGMTQVGQWKTRRLYFIQ
jgi:hypothetical protein